MASPKTSSFVKLTAQPGQRDELLAALQKMLPVVAEEEGTEVYSFHLDRGDENTIWIFEMYADDDALGVHSSSDAMKVLLNDLGGLIGDAPLMVFTTPTDAKGLDI
jgi:quinol monooxygenase YgiN